MDFSGKAKTLLALNGILKQSTVLPIKIFSVEEYRTEKKRVINDVINSFCNELIIVRSSAKNEDGFLNSNAGQFDSVLNVPSNDFTQLEEAIETVIESFDINNPENEVFVQPMLKDVKISGVAFTSDLDTLAPYYIINYEEGGKTNTITSGAEGLQKTYVCLKNVTCNIQLFDDLISAFKEIEAIFNCNYIDVEFAVTHQNKIVIFQVRPISVKNKVDYSQIQLKEGLRRVEKKIQKLMKNHPNLLGKKSVFGVMPDWNPAEIIGIKPKPLALSLYKELITDSIWAYQRDNYGYRNLRSHPLLVSFLGVPYIDVRVDFNSFIPKQLDDKIAEKLVDFYIDKLIRIPSYHDKIEFEIVHSCYYLNINEKLKELTEFGFDENEINAIKDSLLNLTNNILDFESGLCRNDLNKIELLKVNYENIINSELSIIDKIYWLLEDCKRYGTLPFAGIARAAFIATQLLRSFVEKQIISSENYHNYLNSLNTITKDIQEDLYLINKKKIKKDDFLLKWGHLRPGTYDILSPRYDESFDMYFNVLPENQTDKTSFRFDQHTLSIIDRELINAGLNITSTDFFSFVKMSIEGREYAKFIFTKSLSEVLKLIKVLGEKNSITIEELSYLDIKSIQKLYSELSHFKIEDILSDNIKSNKELYQYTKAVRLPSLILNPEEIYGFYLLNEEPNFITHKSITAQVLSENNLTDSEVEGKIIFIKSADPGYDYLFTKKIGGLVTQFGGANSHMAVRCAELGIPAIIGAGEKKFNEWLSYNLVTIDCKTKQVFKI
jgi:phosphoenolpyruvate synthase/pyruvate phosphate dikinase